MSSVRRALALSLIERYLLIAFALVGNILVARLLTPSDIGVYSVSLAVIGIAQVLRDFGIGNFLIQEKSLSDDHIRTAFGISLIIGGGLFLVVAIGAPFAADFYKEQRMVSTMRISALNFLVLPFCTISQSLLRREMLFQRLLYVNLSTAVAGFVVTVVMAYSGFGANSMAYGSVASNVVMGVGAWWSRPDRKALRPSLSEWRALLSFGGQSSISGIVTTISLDANDLVVGKLLGFNPVAILSRAQGLMNMFHRDLMAAVRGVALPAYAAAHRRNEDVEAAYQRSVSLVTVFAWPFYGMVSIYALEVLRWLYGPQWDGAAPLVPVFCLAGAVGALNSLTPALLLSVGRIDLVTRGELILQPLRFALIALAAVLWRSEMAVALAFLLATAIGVPAFAHFKRQALPAGDAAASKGLGPSALVTLASLVLPALQVFAFGRTPGMPLPVASVAAVIAASILLWIVAARWFRHPIADEPLFVRCTSQVGRLRFIWKHR